MVRLIKEDIYNDWDFHVEARRDSLKKFINDTVKHFTEIRVVPTLDQIMDYVTSDRWFKTCIYDGANCNVKQRGWECLPLKDVCDNIQNLCSFNLDDMYESYEGERRWVSTDVEKPIAWKLKDYLRSNGIYFEPSSNGNLVHFEVKANAQEVKQINDFIDSLDYSYITQDMMKDDEY